MRITGILMCIGLAAGCAQESMNDGDDPLGLVAELRNSDVRWDGTACGIDRLMESHVREIDDSIAEERELRRGQLGRQEYQWLSWRTMSSMVDRASQLAEEAKGDEAITFLHESASPAAATGWGEFVRIGFHDIGCRLATLALAMSSGEPAAEALGDLIREESALAILAASYAPSKRIVPVLREIVAEDTNRTPQYEKWIRQPAIELLAILGEEAETVELLQASAEAARYEEYALFRLAQVEKIQDRLAIQDDTRRAGWRQEELLYWQCTHDMPWFRIPEARVRGAAKRHFSEGARFSVEFLRSKLPDRFAMMMAGLQKEQDLIRDLEAVLEAEAQGPLSSMAATALQRIREEGR